MHFKENDENKWTGTMIDAIFLDLPWLECDQIKSEKRMPSDSHARTREATWWNVSKQWDSCFDEFFSSMVWRGNAYGNFAIFLTGWRIEKARKMNWCEELNRPELNACYHWQLARFDWWWPMIFSLVIKGNHIQTNYPMKVTIQINFRVHYFHSNQILFVVLPRLVE